MEETFRIIDVLRAQTEYLALAESAHQTMDDGYPIARVDDVTDSQSCPQRPSLTALLSSLGHRTDFACIGLLASRLSSTAAARREESSDRMPRRWSVEETVDSSLDMKVRRSAAVMSCRGS